MNIEIYILWGVVFFSVFIMTLAGFSLLRQIINPLRRRSRTIRGVAGSTRSTLAETARLAILNSANMNRLKEKISRSDYLYLDPEKKSYRKIRQKLCQAGMNHPNSIQIFILLKILSLVSLLFLCSFFFTLGLTGNAGIAGRIFSTILILVTAWYLPDTFLVIKIHKRQAEIGSGLADALDLLVICVEAGLGLNSAIMRVGQEMKLRSKAIGEEFMLVTQEIRTGESREQALRNLAYRNRIKDLNILTGALILADRLGTSIADTLRINADSMRTRMRQRAEEQAAKASIKMLLPLLLFIFPALLIVILGPAILSIFKAVSSM